MPAHICPRCHNLIPLREIEVQYPTVRKFMWCNCGYGRVVEITVKMNKICQ